MGLLEERARAADADGEPIGIGPGIGGVERRVAAAEGERPIETALVFVGRTGILVLRPDLEVVVAVLAGDEPGERVVELNARR